MRSLISAPCVAGSGWELELCCCMLFISSGLIALCCTSKCVMIRLVEIMRTFNDYTSLIPKAPNQPQPKCCFLDHFGH